MKRLELLDYVRFFAVIMVVLFHYTFNGIANGKITSIVHTSWLIEITKYGYLGVELFFMVSGYVIFFSARSGNAAKFAVSRAIRLYPAYWFAVLFTSGFALHWGGKLMSVYPSMVVVNLSMLQSFVGIGDVDGAYWTLAYEISFYAAVFLILLIGWQKYLHITIIFWPILFFVALIFKRQYLPYFGGYYYYFCAGALFAVLKEKFDWRAAISLLGTYALCVTYSANKAGDLTHTKGSDYNALVIGSLVSLFFVLFIFQNTKRAQLLTLPMSKMAGALTYPIYLIHAHFGYMVISQFATDENKIIVLPLTILIVFGLAYLLHTLVEVRFSSFWKKLFNSTLGRFVRFLQAIPSKLKAACVIFKQ